MKEAEKVSEWGGADVIIQKKMTPQTKKWLDNQNTVISSQNTDPMKRAVITPYFHELSWLFMQLMDIYSGHYDYISKYDLFGGLAQTAIDAINENPGISCEELLMTVFNKSKDLIIQINLM
ncbi:hypothetical protein [Methanobacterium veterum]|nr:hypothetical protein [Methanobacterium veterum]MCZ3367269.1 hypothetical protein [Methanobacterium veterum]